MVEPAGQLFSPLLLLLSGLRIARGEERVVERFWLRDCCFASIGLRYVVDVAMPHLTRSAIDATNVFWKSMIVRRSRERMELTRNRGGDRPKYCIFSVGKRKLENGVSCTTTS